MKQYILLAATALTLAACTNDEMTTATDGKVALKVNASIGTVDTRAVGTQWTTGDQIGISTEEGTGTYYKNVCYEWDGSSFTTSPNNAIFFETSETVTFHAYYPYKGSADYTGVSTAADNQTTANQPKIDFLYASGATASKDKPTVSQITLTFIEGDGMDLDGSWSYTLGGLKLQGTFFPQTGNATADDVTAAPLTVNLTEVQPTSGSYIAPSLIPTSGSYIAPSLILFPQEVTSIPITVTVGGQDYTATLSVKDGKLQSGNNYTWKITVSKTGISVGKAEIKNWETVDNDGATATM